MPFHFRLHNPPCDVAFLSIVDGEALYNADHARTRDVKEATIRQMGWHRVELPQDWFLSQQARDTTTQVLEAMQCTVQYLKHCAKNEEKRAQKATTQLRRCEEERAAAFEELIELRETLALYKRQLRELGQSTRASRASPQRQSAAVLPDTTAGAAPGHLQCSFCANVYPSRHALESHFRKRHKRTEGYATMAAASAAIAAEQQRQEQLAPTAVQEPAAGPKQPPQYQQRNAAGLPFMVNTVAASSPFQAATQAAETRGDRGLREEVSELRLAVARLVEQQAELHRGLSPTNLAAVPLAAAGDMPTSLTRTTGAGALPGYLSRASRAVDEDILLRIQRELLHTGAELQQLQSAVEADGAGRGRNGAPPSSNGDDGAGEKEVRSASSSKSARGLGSAAGLVAPRLNPQSFLRTSTGTDGSDAPVERRRPSIADSLVVVSPITPPARGGPLAWARGVPTVPPVLANSVRATITGAGDSSDTQHPTAVGRTIAGPRKRSDSTSSERGPHSIVGSDHRDRGHALGRGPLNAHLSSSRTTPDSRSTSSHSVADVGTTAPRGAGPSEAGGAAALTPPETPVVPSSSPSIGSLVLLPGGHGGAGGSPGASRRDSNGMGADRYGGPHSDEALSWTSGGLREASTLPSAAVTGHRYPEVSGGRPTAAAVDGTPTLTEATPSPTITAAKKSAHARHGGVGAQHSDSLDSSDDTWTSMHLRASRQAAASAVPPERSDSSQPPGTERAGHRNDILSVQREGTPPTMRPAPESDLQSPDVGPATSGSPLQVAADDESSKPPRSHSPFLGRTLQRTHTEVRAMLARALAMDTTTEDDSGSGDNPSRTVPPSGQPRADRAHGKAQSSSLTLSVGSSHGQLPASKILPVVRLVPEALPSESGELSPSGPLNRHVTSPPHARPESSSASSLLPPLWLDDSLPGVVAPLPLPNVTAAAHKVASFSTNVPLPHRSDGGEKGSRHAESAQHAEAPHSVPLDITAKKRAAGGAGRGGVGVGADDPVMEDVLTDDGPPVSGAFETCAQEHRRNTQVAAPVRPGVTVQAGPPPAAVSGPVALPRVLPDKSVGTPSRAGTPNNASLSEDYSYYSYSESDDEAVEARHAAAEMAAVARGKQTFQVSPMTSFMELEATPTPASAPVPLRAVVPLASVETQAAPAKGTAKSPAKKPRRGEAEAASAAPPPRGASPSGSRVKGAQKQQAQHSAAETPRLPRHESPSLVPPKAAEKKKTLFSSLFKSKGDSGRTHRK